jgi:hypothetical protein
MAAGISNAITTSTGVLPSENNLKACDSFDFALLSISSSSVHPLSISASFCLSERRKEEKTFRVDAICGNTLAGKIDN